MTDEDISHLTAQFADAIATLDALTGRNGAALDHINAAHQCWDALLAEMERSREIVRPMADYTCEHDDYTGYYACGFCGVLRREEPPWNITEDEMRKWITHKPECPVVKARALLAGEREKQP